MFMKTITTNNRTLLFVEVPEDAVIEMSEDDTVLLYQLPPNLALNDPMWQLPLPVSDKNYNFIATTDTIELIDKVRILGGKEPNHDWDRYFQSFLDNHSITGRHAIIEVL